jgi:hypothetical protein
MGWNQCAEGLIFLGVAAGQKPCPHLEKYSTDEVKSKGRRRVNDAAPVSAFAQTEGFPACVSGPAAVDGEGVAVDEAAFA